MKGTEYRVIRMDKKNPSGNITEAIIDDLRVADLVIVDLTNLNPNVMYELGIRQAWNLPLVPIALKGQNMPFDVKVLNIVFYELPITTKAINEAKRDIRKQIRNIIKDEQSNIIFERANAIISKSYSMDAVYESFEQALNDMHHSLGKCRHDMLSKIIWDDKISLEDLAEDVANIFEKMSDKTYVYDQIAMRNICDPDSLDTQFTSLLRKVDQLDREGDRIAKIVMMEGKNFDKKTKSISKIDELMVKVRKIAKLIKHKKL